MTYCSNNDDKSVLCFLSNHILFLYFYIKRMVYLSTTHIKTTFSKAWTSLQGLKVGKRLVPYFHDCDVIIDL